jgi:hypothetical protein
MSLTKLSMARNNKNIPGQREFVTDIPAGDGLIVNLFLQRKTSAIRVFRKQSVAAIQYFLKAKPPYNYILYTVKKG